MSTKTTFIFDQSLISGSTDLFRNNFGGFYVSEESESGTSLAFATSSFGGGDQFVNYPINIEIGRVFVFGAGGGGDTAADLETADYNNLIPNYSFPVRLASNSENMNSDQEWRAFIVGGEYGEKTYSTKISNTIHEFLSINYDMPYSKKETAYLENENISDVITISYDYSQHLAEYEETVNNFETEMYMPNYYILSDFYQNDGNSLEDFESIYDSRLVDFVSLGGNYETPQSLFAFNNSRITYIVPPFVLNSFKEIRKENTDLSLSYLTSSVFASPTNSDTANWATSKQKTIFIDDEAVTNLVNAEPIQDCLPYKIKINFPKQHPGDFIETYKSNDYDCKILLNLNEAFVAQQDLKTTTKTYSKSSEYLSGSSDNIASTVTEIEDVDYREIDYIEFLTYCRDQYKNTNSDAMFVGPNNIKRLSALDENGIYRHVNTRNSLSVLEQAINYLNDLKIEPGAFNDPNIYLQDQSYSETIAYRIEKIGGPGSGDRLTQNVLQNYWFINSDSTSEIDFFDSQIKVNSDYTYNVYAYVLVSGFKYEYSNPLVTRNLGADDELADNGSSYLHGLEFYDPAGEDGNRQDELYTVTPNGFFNNALAEDAYGSDPQLYSNFKYLADFEIKYEPFIKIIEIPIHSKTLRVMDNPPNVLNVVPYQMLDDSQRVAFDLYYDVFSTNKFPSVISESDLQYKENYLNGKDILEITKIRSPSVSKQRTVEVYRLTTKPTSVEDFDGNLYKTLDLTVPDNRFYRYTYDTCVSQIKTNQKYYYLFRVLNELGTPGHISEIYETELINDGGYKFALFNTINEAELGDSPPPKVNKEFKKLFQIRPKFEQIKLDTTNVDFEQSAGSQVSSLAIGTADDLIWDKTFKFRLTSKKTGKKIDLNITYKISGE